MPSNVIVAGAGMAGYAAARALERFAGEEITITVVNPTNAVVYPPVLPEVAGGSVAPRQAVSPLRAGLRRSRLVVGELCGLDRTQRVAAVKLADGTRRELPWDHVVLGFGSITRLLPIDGLTDAARGFTTLAEARVARERVIERVELAAATDDAAARRRALTFVVVGGGYTGVEAVAELQRLSEATAAAIGSLGEAPRWHLVEASDTPLSVVRASLAERVTSALRQRDIELHLECTVDCIDGTELSLSDGTVLDADSVWWCAGVVAHPAHEALGVPTDDRGRVIVDACGAVEHEAGVWAAGDGAAFPDVLTGRLCPPSAQYAVRQGRQVGHNIARVVQGLPAEPLRYRSRGELISLGRGEGVGEVFGVPVTGRPAWYLRRLYHLLTIPTWRRKGRLWVDWTASLWFPPEIVMLGERSSTAAMAHAARTQGLPEPAAGPDTP
ncbi:MAG: NAD(P)/FAD-dependent oxidoreductase [Vicinamibacterales bacterium]